MIRRSLDGQPIGWTTCRVKALTPNGKRRYMHWGMRSEIHTTLFASVEGGSITMVFDPPISNGPGWDFAVFENSFSDSYLELAYVEASSDGISFYRFPNDSLTAEPVSSFGTIDPSNISGLASKYRQGFGTPFNLDDLPASSNFDPSKVAYIRLIDIVGDGSCMDTSGDAIYDPYPTSTSAGFDLEAIGVKYQYLNTDPEKPWLLFPENGATEVTPPVTLMTDDFFDPDALDAHLQTSWRISEWPDFSFLTLDETTQAELTSFTVPDGILEDDTVYYWRARFADDRGGESEWSETFSFATAPVDIEGEQPPDDVVYSGPYAPAAGEPESTAVSMDDPALVGWAADWMDYYPGEGVDANCQTPALAMGQAVGEANDTVCLGGGGRITLAFDPPISNGPGWDFAVFGGSIGDFYLSLAYVEASSDGISFYRFPNDSLTSAPFDGSETVDPSNISGLASKYRQGFGTPFNLDDLPASSNFDPSKVAYIRLIDIVGDGSCVDTSGDVIYDPYPTSISAGFDLEAIGVRYQYLNTDPEKPLLLFPENEATEVTPPRDIDD